eukprot:11192210-Alexandrium_andersonii.AAC.1
MLQSVSRCQGSINVFAVVKRADVQGGSPPRIRLRLVFDHRRENFRWRTPPWMGLRGPEALASLDMSAPEIQDWRFQAATGDIPHWYYCLGIPEEASEFFCLPG